jgi:hypothetical protein
MDRKAILVIADRIRSLTPKADISEVMEAVGDLLDDSIIPTKAGYVIQDPAVGGQFLDLSKIDFDALKQQFERATSASRRRGCAASSTASCSKYCVSTRPGWTTT